MDFGAEGSFKNFNFSEVNGIGGITTVPNDRFKKSVEEAIHFLELFKTLVDENLKVLQDIDKCKKEKNSRYTNDNLIRTQDEVKAMRIFETLQSQLQNWQFGVGGISLTKN